MVQVIVSDPNINRLDQPYGEPVVTVNGKKLRMAQATDGNWYGYFADRNQAITASNTAPVPAKGLNFGAFCKSGTIGGVDFGSQTKGFTVAENGFDGAIGLSVTGSKIPIGPLSNTCTGFGNGMVLEHVVRENKTLNTNSAGYGASAKLESAWPVIQLYDFSAIPTAVTVDYQAAGGDQVVNLTFDKIPSNLISVATDKPAYIASAPVLMTINDPQLGIDPTEEDSWTWGANANNNTLFYEAFDRNGRSDADGYCVTTAKTQVAVGNGPTGITYDSAKGELFVTNYYSRTVSVISDVTNSVVATIPVKNAPRGIAYDSAKGELFVTNDGGGNISVISDVTNSVVATIPVGSNTTAITYDQSLGEIFVGDDGQDKISVINDASNSVNTTIPLSGGTWAMAYDSFKEEIFAVSQDSGVKSVSIVSPDTGSIRSTISLTDYPSSIAYDPARGEVFVGLSYANSTSVISDSSDSVIATIPVGNSPTGVVYDPTRNDIFVTNYFSQTVSVINDLSNSVVATIPVRDVLSGAAYDSAKDEIFAISNSAKTYILPAIPGWTYIQTACSSGTVPAMQNLIGNLTSFMFDHNGRLTIDPSPNGTRILDFQSNGRQILNGSSFTRGDPTKQTTASIGPGSEPITFIEMGGVNTGVFGNWDGKKKPDLAVTNSLNIKGLQATFSYNNIAGSIVAQWGGDTVLLKSTAFEPTPNPFSIMSFQNGLKAGQKYHFLIQFNSPPTSSDQAELASQGITLLQYVSGNTFVASGIASPFSILSIPPDVRWTGQFLSSYKISPILAANDTSKIPSWALENAPGTSLPSYAVITADLNIDANMTNVAQTITSYGGMVEAEVPLVPSVTAVLPLTNLYSTITKIAQIDDVQFIDVVEPPLVAQSDNGTITANADYVNQRGAI
ncbi:hypothetical protein DYY67_1402 [Candidatus Nitrosotalea sp. TS]|uniref:YncE family protein n=1 Tax=Candidatus Nitrosotalea sp. TS TaxID=2341020 RepID=UPI0014072D38|nr:YncE family protein [Candidatus Nitrosotalea sp. TS]NHI04027.1 hypothetical protein [Candidatus Nitrosotalea sp. TS]